MSFDRFEQFVAVHEFSIRLASAVEAVHNDLVNCPACVGWSDREWPMGREKPPLRLAGTASAHNLMLDKLIQKLTQLVYVIEVGVREVLDELDLSHTGNLRIVQHLHDLVAFGGDQASVLEHSGDSLGKVDALQHKAKQGRIVSTVSIRQTTTGTHKQPDTDKQHPTSEHPDADLLRISYSSATLRLRGNRRRVPSRKETTTRNRH